MPCNDSYSEDNYRDQSNTIEQLEKRNIYIEACLCALITELENRGILIDIMRVASENGMVDIEKFWEQHRKEDIERIKGLLHSTFSKHEIDIIKKLLP